MATDKMVVPVPVVAILPLINWRGYSFLSLSLSLSLSGYRPPKTLGQPPEISSSTALMYSDTYLASLVASSLAGTSSYV